MTPISDPLTFWTRATLRLGLILLVLAVAPAVIDYVFFRGAAIVIAIIAINTLAPLAVICLLIGAGLWVYGRLRK